MSAEAALPEVLVATSNPGKLREMREILADLPLRLVGLPASARGALPAEGDDYEQNARAKARAAADATGRPALADDSGLEVDGLGGAPGPRSARYGGPGLDDAGRTASLLGALRGCQGAGRRARFVCVVALAAPGGAVATARGECAGSIRREPAGAAGFGYDPVFEVEGLGRTLAECSADEKNRISHRARALRGLLPALRALAYSRANCS